MEMGTVPIDTWMVVEPITFNSVKPVSLRASQAEAEAERDRRNKNLTRPRYQACIAAEPMAERMGSPIRLACAQS